MMKVESYLFTEPKHIMLINRKNALGQTDLNLRKVSLRLPEIMISELKQLANKRDIPYQSLMKLYLAERIQKELNQ